jgi:peptidoglycan/xylan/chitin deacetylase (PgdA/CDA1 family)
MGKEELSFEVTRSKDIIEKNTGGPIRAFCYPHGAFDANVKEAVKSAGFGCASSGIEGVNTPGSDIFELRRTEITSSDDTELKFEKKLFGYHDWLGHLGVHR